MKFRDIPQQPDGTKLVCTSTPFPEYWTVGKEYMVHGNYITNDVGTIYKLSSDLSLTKFDIIPPQPKFIRSVMKNSEEAQLGLLSLGYKWRTKGALVHFLNWRYLYTCTNGYLHVADCHDPSVPEDQFEFTTTVTVTAKMKPQPVEPTSIQKEITEIEKQQRELADRLNKLKEAIIT